MKKISYSSDVVFYAAGRSVEDARERAKGDENQADTPREAWNALGYWDREEHADEFEVFEFRVTEKITKVEPPYSN
ncbi:hypothetical protein ACFWNC_14660 [Streptomyces sp. NPDC058369]|uniref:hypothetical protein n=1 Tax=Streptomyces sp. NPDC058369 TaxID=3346462 RepID=UPI003664C7CD